MHTSHSAMPQSLPLLAQIFLTNPSHKIPDIVPDKNILGGASIFRLVKLEMHCSQEGMRQIYSHSRVGIGDEFNHATPPLLDREIESSMLLQNPPDARHLAPDENSPSF